MADKISVSKPPTISEAERQLAGEALRRYFEAVWAGGGRGREIIEQAVARAAERGEFQEEE